MYYNYFGLGFIQEMRLKNHRRNWILQGENTIEWSNKLGEDEIEPKPISSMHKDQAIRERGYGDKDTITMTTNNGRHNNNYKKKQNKVWLGGSWPAQVRKPISPTKVPKGRRAQRKQNRTNGTNEHQKQKSTRTPRICLEILPKYTQFLATFCFPNFPIKSYFLSDLVKVWPRIIMAKLHPPCHKSQIFCSIQFCPPTSLKHLTRQN